jgi:adenine-specific DNA-methyltransferase
MEKLKMMTIDNVNNNISKIATLFPNCITEKLDKQGNSIRAIDFDKLKQELSSEIVESREERYQFTWPDKKKAIILANSPINATLRPCREESVDFDNTQNLYIEGDNLDVLKCLKETYLGKVKMIYIDPPYNTGNDFVYEDDFAETSAEYLANSGQFDEQGNRLVTNTESNGRFHTDWLNMIYPRLKVARDLLTDDGVIFISIDENEVHNMRKLCDEIFGEQNFISQLGWQKVYSPKNQARYFSNDYEYVLCYCHNIDVFSINLLPRTAEMNSRYKNPDNDPRGDWKAGDCVGNGVRKNGYYDVVSPKTGKVFNVPQGKHWVYAPDNMKRMIEENKIWFGKDGNAFPSVKQFLTDVSGRRPSSLLMYEDYGHTDMAKKDLIKLFPDLEKVPFDTPKPVKLLKMLSIIGSAQEDIILDFFSGSATLSQAIMELNAESGSNRKYILVQLPEIIDDNPGAHNIGLSTIASVGKERIRRAGKKIKEDSPLTTQTLDTGFRVLKLDSTNMEDVYYAPSEYSQEDLFSKTENVKSDRTAEDLLFQVMLELGATLDSKIESTEVAGKKIFNVADNYLVACFDTEASDEVVTAIAKMEPQYAVFRDSCIANDSTATNFEQIFKSYSPSTTTKVL